MPTLSPANLDDFVIPQPGGSHWPHAERRVHRRRTAHGIGWRWGWAFPLSASGPHSREKGHSNTGRIGTSFMYLRQKPKKALALQPAVRSQRSALTAPWPQWSSSFLQRRFHNGIAPYRIRGFTCLFFPQLGAVVPRRWRRKKKKRGHRHNKHTKYSPPMGNKK